MGLVDRVANIVAGAGTTFDTVGVASEARRVLALEAPLASDETVDLVVGRVLGLGPLEPLLADPGVTDILINGPFEVWVDRRGELELTGIQFRDNADVMAMVERSISALGRRIDRSSPMVEARLPDGSRLHAAIPPAAVDYPIVAIRRFSRAVETFDQFIANDSATPAQVDFLRRGVVGHKTIVVSGGTGAGKTTLLNLLAESIPSSERVVTVEDAAELRFSGHVVRLESRPPNAEAAGEITIRQLLRSALRLRPDRIILGEVRGPEALDLITALNTGHRGSMSTVHANSPQEAMWRLETLALLDGVASPEAVTRQLYSAVDHVVQMSRSSGRRAVTEICRVDSDGSVCEVSLG